MTFCEIIRDVRCRRKLEDHWPWGDRNMLTPEWRKIIARAKQTSVKARARDSGDLRSALTEFVPALRCHYPGQAGFLKADSKT
jgi:hypothetical protein